MVNVQAWGQLAAKSAAKRAEENAALKNAASAYDLCAELHVGAYKVYKDEDRTNVILTQTMSQESGGMLHYEGSELKIVDSAAKIVTAHGFTGTVKPGGEIVWAHGYISVPSGEMVPAKMIAEDAS